MSHNNTIAILGGDNHNIVLKGKIIAKFKTNEIKNISKILLVSIKKKLLFVGAILDVGFSINFIPKACLLKNIKMRAIVLRGTIVKK
jgi:hypothetical protein